MKRKTLSLLGLALFASTVSGAGSPASAADVWGLTKGTPELQSAATLAFGPEDILFIGDTKGAAVFAIATGNKKGDASKADINIEDLPAAIANEIAAKSVVRIFIGNVHKTLEIGEYFSSIWKNDCIFDSFSGTT